MSTTDKQIDGLLRDAIVAAMKMDADRLQEIARELNRLGAWDDASLVENKAQEVTRRLAEAIA